MRAAIHRAYGESLTIEDVSSHRANWPRAKTASAAARPSRDEGLAYIAALRAAGVTVVDRHELLREPFARH